MQSWYVGALCSRLCMPYLPCPGGVRTSSKWGALKATGLGCIFCSHEDIAPLDPLFCQHRPRAGYSPMMMMMPMQMVDWRGAPVGVVMMPAASGGCSGLVPSAWAEEDGSATEEHCPQALPPSPHDRKIPQAVRDLPAKLGHAQSSVCVCVSGRVRQARKVAGEASERLKGRCGLVATHRRSSRIECGLSRPRRGVSESNCAESTSVVQVGGRHRLVRRARKQCPCYR